ncbi:protein of unknown function DUF4009 [Penicillium expansum]|nr:protein of unknown function DUF4009 [Penicillium expansum]
MSSRTIYNPVKDYTIPNTDLLSLVFDDTVLHVEGADPSNNVTKSQCREYTMQIAHILRERFAIGALGPRIDTAACISTGQILLPALFYGVISAGGVYSAAIRASQPESCGTTGEPKSVQITHENLVSAAFVNLYAFCDYISRQKAQSPGFTPEYRTVAHLPAAHIAGCQGYFLQPVLCGGTIYWMPKFELKSFLLYSATYRPTFLFTFDYMIYAVSGAAPMGPDLVIRASKALGCPISQTWGLSETTGSVTISPWDEFESDGSLSPLLPNIRMRIVDEAENDVEDGQEGEFIVQGPMITRGYWKNEEATRSSFTVDGEWFKTGDLGLRRNGKIFIIDRKKDMIKYKSLQVALAELEGLLLSHSLIKDIAVIGVPDVQMAGNDLPRAYVVADQSKITEDAIKSFVRDNLTSHKQLRGGVIFVPEIPKSPTGKILRKELRQAAAMEIKAKL